MFTQIPCSPRSAWISCHLVDLETLYWRVVPEDRSSSTNCGLCRHRSMGLRAGMRAADKREGWSARQETPVLSGCRLQRTLAPLREFLIQRLALVVASPLKPFVRLRGQGPREPLRAAPGGRRRGTPHRRAPQECSGVAAANRRDSRETASNAHGSAAPTGARTASSLFDPLFFWATAQSIAQRRQGRRC
jgi:hypothetical protein